MRTLVLGYAETLDLLDFRGLVPVMAKTLADLSRGDAEIPPRQMLNHPSYPGLIAWMPAVLPQGQLFGSKVISVYPENRKQGQDSHQGVVLLFTPENGHPCAILDADAITARRTAAVSAAATDLLALPDADSLALLGSGSLAKTHLEAMLSVRGVRRVSVCSRDPRHAEQFVRRMRTGVNCEIHATQDAKSAVAEADIVCTLTDATSPLLERAWLRPGAHVNAVGAASPGYRELDDDLVRTSRVYVDYLAHCLTQADDIRVPLAAGLIAAANIVGEIGDVVSGNRQGRTSREEITVFKSVGLAIEDLAAAAYCLSRAEAEGKGTWLEFSGAPE